MSAFIQQHTINPSDSGTEHILTDTRGDSWIFQVFPDSETVMVISPACRTRQPCTLKYHRVFLRDAVQAMPQYMVLRMFEEARVFSREYSRVIKPYTHDDGISNQFEVGILIRFTPEHWSLLMEREDARRLWGLLSSAR